MPTLETRRFAIALGALTLAAIVIRLLYTGLVDPEAADISDASAYHLLGRHLADGLGYIRPFDFVLLDEIRATAEYPPLFPLLLSLLARLGVESVDAQELVGGTLIGASSVALIGVLGRRVGDAVVGLGAAAIAAAYPMLFQLDAVLMTEGLYALLVTATMLLAYAVIDAPTLPRAVALGGVLGLAALTRTEAILLAVFLGTALLIRGARRHAHAEVWLAGTTLLVAALVVVPWTARNQVRFDTFVPVSNNLGTVLDGANCDLTYSGRQIGLWRSQFAEGGSSAFGCFQGFDIADADFDEAEAAAFHRREGLDYARDHASRVPVVVGARLLRTFALFPDIDHQIDVESLEGRERTTLWLGTVAFWLLIPLAVGGGVLLRRRGVPIWPLLAPIATVIVTTLVTYGNQRFRTGAEPAIIVLGACGGVAAIRAWAARGATASSR